MFVWLESAMLHKKQFPFPPRYIHVCPQIVQYDLVTKYGLKRKGANLDVLVISYGFDSESEDSLVLVCGTLLNRRLWLGNSD